MGKTFYYLYSQMPFRGYDTMRSLQIPIIYSHVLRDYIFRNRSRICLQAIPLLVRLMDHGVLIGTGG